MLKEADITKLKVKYGIDGTKCTQLSSMTAEEITDLTGRKDIEGGGIGITYCPEAPLEEQTIRIRLENPLTDSKTGRQIRYLSLPGQPNALFIPVGMNFSQRQVLLTEGEFKALAAWQRGIPCVAVSGVWNWRTGSGLDGIELADKEALIPELRRDWTGHDFCLIYDSDIDPSHPAWTAFTRLAEQLYAQGAVTVRIMTLPTLKSKDSEDAGSKVGLDDFILHMEKLGKNAAEELKWLSDRNRIYLPSGDGVEKFCEPRMRIDARNSDRMDAYAVLFGNSPLQFEEAIERNVKGEVKRRAIRKEVKSRLHEIRNHQAPAPHSFKPPTDPLYLPYIEGLAKTNYVIDRTGCLYRLRGGEFNSGATKLANGVLRIEREIHVDDGSGTPRREYVEVGGIRETGVAMASRTISLEDFSSPQVLRTLFGAKFIIEPVTAAENCLRHAAQILGKDAPTITRYGHTGWRNIGNRWVYLHAGGAIGGNGIDVTLEEGGTALSAYRLPDSGGDESGAMRRSLSILDLAPYNIVIPLLATTYLAPLLELFNQARISIGFSGFITGDSGSQKSTVAALMLSHFGSFTRTSLPASFLATANSIERIAFILKDTLLVIDDRYPTENPREQEQFTSTFNRLVREFGNRKGRSRCNADSSLRPDYPPRGLALFTMELSASGQSTVARGIELQFKRGAINLEKLSTLQEHSEELSIAMRGFIAWIGENFEQIVKEVQDRFPTERNAFNTAAQHGQIPEHLAAMQIAIELMSRYAMSVAALTEQEKAELLASARVTLESLGVHQSDQVADETPVQIMDRAIDELFAAKTIHLRSLTGGPPNHADALGWERMDESEYRVPERSVHIGWADDRQLYLLPETFFSQLVRFRGRQNLRFPLDLKALCRRLKDAGRLDTYVNGQRETFRKKIVCEGVLQRVLVIRRGDGNEE